MKWYITRLPLILVGVFATSCISQADLDEIKATQKLILTKLDVIAKRPVAAAAKPRRPRGPDPEKTYAFPVEGSPVLGPRDALVTIMEISDFQCTYCKRAGSTIKKIIEKYPKEVRVVFKHNPLSFHKRAMPAANATMCANEQGKFWPMHDVVFANNRALEDADLEGYAKKTGLDMARYKSCYTANKFKAQILKDQKTTISLGARGTPAFFINGRYLSGARPLPAFQKIIDEELKKAKESGIASAEYYDKAIVEKGEKRM